MRAYYNEIDPFAAAWLRELIADGLVPAGDVDERDIRDVLPSDLDGYRQCHFFAGIGGWPYALHLAGWPDDRPVWTGSCPCQPFSAAGRSDGFADERHLWPAFFHLIGECRPPIVFGEQVASKAGLGWLDLVHSDLEGAGYAVGAADLCAAGVGAPHIRQRLFWCARDLADATEQGRRTQPIGPAGADGRQASELGRLRNTGAVANGIGPRLEGRDGRERRRQVGEDAGGRGCGSGAQGMAERPMHKRACGHWSDIEWLPCRDGKARPTQPGLQPLAHGVSNRVGTLRGAGNAIVLQAAVEFIFACM